MLLKYQNLPLGKYLIIYFLLKNTLFNKYKTFYLYLFNQKKLGIDSLILSLFIHI